MSILLISEIFPPRHGGIYPELLANAECLGVLDIVQFLREADDSDLVKCCQPFDLFILPNRTDGNDIEGIGMVRAEAQASGKPVMADCTAARIIARTVTNVRRDAEEGGFQANRCRRHVLENFTWSPHTRKAQGMFQELGGVA